MLITNIILSIMSGIALHYYLKLNIMYAIIIGIALFVLLSYVNEGFAENFQSGGADMSRIVKYGDSIVIWSWRSAYVRTRADGVTDIGPRLSTPAELPSVWALERYTIEDANDSRGGPANSNAVKYGDVVYLKTWNTTYLSARDNNTVTSANRDSWEKVTLESPEISGKHTRPINYGDMIYFKTWRNTYLAVTQNKDDLTQVPNKDSTGLFRIYDNYGQDTQVDWARRGTATQSSNYGQFPASNVVNGDLLSFNHTQEEQSAWWQIRLPKEVLIDNIIITNRKDCCQDRLRNFDLIIMNDENQTVLTKNFTDVLPEYNVTGINKIGRIVRVQLREKNYLHLSSVRVYGQGVDYSILLERPVVSDLITTETKISDKITKLISHDNIPITTGSITYMFFIKPLSNDSGRKTIMFKGDTHIFSNSGVISATIKTKDHGAQDLVTSFSLPVNQWSHVTLVVDAGVTPQNGWIFGEFNQKPDDGPTPCCYVVHPILRQYYYVKNQELFGSKLKNNWDVSLTTGMTYMGELNAQNIQKSATLFANGRKIKELQLQGAPLHNKSAITLGKPNIDGMFGANFIIDRLKVFNYATDPKIIRRESKYSHGETTIDLLRGIHDSKTEVTIEPHILPDSNTQCSISFWFNSGRDNSGTQTADSLVIKNNAGIHAPAISISSNKLILGDNKDNTSKTELEPSVWYHITEVINGQKFILFINGKPEIQGTFSVPVSKLFTISPIIIGGAEGKFKDMRYSNYALTEEEVINTMGRYPDYKEQEAVRKLWTDSGCHSNPFKHFNDNNEWVQLYKSGNSSKLEDIFKTIKSSADKGDKQALIKCYGPFAAGLYGKLGDKEKLLSYAMSKDKQGKKCLPMAPFNCNKKNVNDFDIRTHRDFYKYVRVDKIIPPASSNDDFANFKNQLDETNKALAEIKKLKDEALQENAKLKEQINSKTGPNGPNGQLTQQYNEQQQKIMKLQSELDKTNKSLMVATSNSNTNNPEYAKMAKDLQNARNLAATNIAQGLDFDKLRTNPLFREVLQEVLARMGGLQQQKMVLASQTAQQKQALNNMVDISKGITADMIKNILSEKESLSDNSEYQKIIQFVKSLAGSKSLTTAPCQSLMKQLNQINRADIVANNKNFEDLKIIAMKCKASFDNEKQANLTSKDVAKVLKCGEKNPKIQALMRNAIKSKSDNDSDFAHIINKLNLSDPEVKKFLTKIMSQHLSSDPVYKKLLTKMISDDPSLKRELIGNWRIEDHPEYNKYAEEMSSQCKRKK